MLRLSSIALSVVLIVPTYTGWAQERVEAGVLQCRGSTTSFGVGSVTELNCTALSCRRPAARPNPIWQE